MANRDPDYSTIPNRIKEITMTEQAGVAVSGVSEPHLKFPLGSEVQLKSLPGFGYTVTAAVKNERALMAMDGSCLGLALVHEIEPYCDIDQAHFVSKASKILWELGAKDASEIAAKELYKAGARFPEGKAITGANLNDGELAALVCDTARSLIPVMQLGRANRSAHDPSDLHLISRWHENSTVYVEVMELAITITDRILSRDCQAALDKVYPRPLDDI